MSIPGAPPSGVDSGLVAGLHMCIIHTHVEKSTYIQSLTPTFRETLAMHYRLCPSIHTRMDAQCARVHVYAFTVFLYLVLISRLCVSRDLSVQRTYFEEPLEGLWLVAR